MGLVEGFPRDDGFAMPGEFAPHAGCWMLWPERGDVWREQAGPARRAFAAVAAAIHRFEPVTVGVLPGRTAGARALLPAGVRVVEIPYDDAWARDTGPTFVTDGNGRVRGVDWAFNAWGGLEEGAYSPWDQDEAVAGRICDLAGVDRYRCSMILEGGSIHVDGEGTLLTTAECLLNPNRNPDLSQAEIEAMLRGYLGIEKIIWIPRGIYKDETWGHVDNIACFARPGEVVLSWCDDRSDPQYEISREAYEVLAAARDARGRHLIIHRIHQPAPMAVTAAEAAGITVNPDAKHRHEGRRLCGSYVNFYIANGGVVMPLFGDPQTDRPAQAALQAIFPDRQVVGVSSREILLGGGNIHCITQQQPAGVMNQNAAAGG